ncbi:MAG: toll/interleukin-1 receptor domain-containing protein, partial [Alphaproteobacteria bacterium]|nr:toll/interleukin-1 receptor domain-containing protein [Alphaproteobacteria bacterium]
MAVPTKRYRSFISYSQTDKRWGRRLHTWLETYRVPVDVIADIQDGRRLGRFFRDEAEMPAASDIAEVVREAIETAESLIVVCSPRSAQSKWVAAEIEHFRRTNPSGQVFAVIIDGVANSGDPATECFPAALRRKSDADGAMPIEPVGIDTRVDSKDRVCARLAAGLLDLDFDDLWQRDRRRAERRQRRTLVMLSAASATFALLACAAVWFALIAQDRTRAAEEARLSLQREYLAILGESAIDDVLTADLDPGALRATDAEAWTPLIRREDQDFILAREFDRGRIFAVAHDGLLDAARAKNGDAFLRRAISWLKGPDGPSTVVITAGHCEWMAIGVDDWLLPGLLQTWGYNIQGAPGPLTDAALAGAGVLIIGNAWGDFRPGELDAIERFVRKGGGV